ncbi:hypothetical protein LX97_00563 [Nonlabens dokdonensis]|jgi:hypothetical protein|uniref:Uncharacterized protein n=1 Tax=Nonlabens dokdonensis TaxID=328515 RepID=A0ABX5Q0U9_9FLAO|nr:hypothetical protein LX97_00563 [Nonlabens dokdonensis]
MIFNALFTALTVGRMSEAKVTFEPGKPSPFSYRNRSRLRHGNLKPKLY